jgi:hypothetical protein
MSLIAGLVSTLRTESQARSIHARLHLLGREMTGLPIDSQIQRQTEANAKYPGNCSALIELQPQTASSSPLTHTSEGGEVVFPLAPGTIEKLVKEREQGWSFEDLERSRTRPSPPSTHTLDGSPTDVDGGDKS